MDTEVIRVAIETGPSMSVGVLLIPIRVAWLSKMCVRSGMGMVSVQ